MINRGSVQGSICEIFNNFMGDVYFVQSVPQPSNDTSFVQPEGLYGTVNLITSERFTNDDYISYKNKDDDPLIPDLTYTAITRRLLTLEVSTYRQGAYNLIQTIHNIFSYPPIVLAMRAEQIGVINVEEIREINLAVDGVLEERYVFNLIISVSASFSSDIESIETQEITGEIHLP